MWITRNSYIVISDFLQVELYLIGLTAIIKGLDSGAADSKGIFITQHLPLVMAMPIDRLRQRDSDTYTVAF